MQTREETSVEPGFSSEAQHSLTPGEGCLFFEVKVKKFPEWYRPSI